MIRLYTPILLLQVFCLYNAYQRNEQQKWYWIIIMLPFIGSLLYIYHTYYTVENVENLTEGVKENFIENYKINKMEKDLNFTDTVANKMKLADEYFSKGSMEKARLLYESCLEGAYEDDPALLTKLLKISFHEKKYQEVIKYGEKIGNDKKFQMSDEKVGLAWSYFNTSDLEKAGKTFSEMDVRFSNYTQRLQYAKFLVETGKTDLAIEKLQKLITEIDSMDNYEKKSKRDIYRVILSYQSQI